MWRVYKTGCENWSQAFKTLKKGLRTTLGAYSKPEFPFAASSIANPEDHDSVSWFLFLLFTNRRKKRKRKKERPIDSLVILVHESDTYGILF